MCAKHRGKKTRRRSRPKISARPELLAPAGSREAFHAAIESGADAVYVGPKILNARAYGRNFTTNEIADLAESASKHGRKLLVAINSLVKEAEIPEAIRLLAALEEIGIDALIIQDLGLWRIARKYFPNLRLHASTLMTIHNSLGVKIAGEMGFSRVVLARELTLNEIATISRNANVELEVFVHGAMCFTVSGLCMFSSYFGGRSSTRGRCVQPCRRRYKWKGVPGTFFSMDDLCGIDAVPGLVRAGVSSLKIEGRLKPPDYVAAVTAAYRMLLDAGPNYSRNTLEQAKSLIDKAMGRPVCTGYFFSDNPGSAISPTRTANTGMYLGKIKPVDKDRYIVKGTRQPRPGDKLRIVLNSKDQQFSATCRDISPAGHGNYYIRMDFPAFTPSCNISNALLFKTESLARKDSRATAGRGPTKTTGNKTAMKGAAARSQRVIAAVCNQPYTHKSPGKACSGKAELFVKLHSVADVKIIGNLDIAGLILDISSKNIQMVSRRLPPGISRNSIIWALPPIVFERRISHLRYQTDLLMRQGFRNFQISNLSHIALFTGYRGRKRLRLFSSYQMNILNHQAVQAARELGISTCHFSVETDFQNMEQSLSREKSDIVFTVYGFIPLFTSRLRHRIYDQKTPVASGRGEEYFWMKSGNVGQLYDSRPFSALGYRDRLLKAGISRWILDLSLIPGKKKLPRRLPGSIKTLARRFRGRNFNLLGTLE